MTTITRIGTTQRWSDVVIHNGTLYVVEVPATETADIHQQTREVLESLQRLLEANGSGVDRILMANIYLKDIEDIAAFNAQWDAWIPAGTAPVRACVQARLAHEGYRVEVQLSSCLNKAGCLAPLMPTQPRSAPAYRPASPTKATRWKCS